MRAQLLSLWPDEDAVSACIKHEAETVDKAVFLAVHQPMQFVRMDQGAKRGTEQILTERDLFEEFLRDKLPEGRLILPIEGSSGVGKSHVIRWLDAQLERRADRETRHVIRIPKGMSLKGVLRRLLDGLEGPRYKELRLQLLSAREKLDPGLAARHLILNICHRLEQEGRGAATRIHNGNGSAEDKLLKSYGDHRALPALIGDMELLHSHWLTREADGSKGVMARLAEQVTDEASGPEDTRQHQIRPEDLQLSSELVGRLNHSAQRFYHSLHGGRGERLDEAARIINRVLDPAKQDLLQLGDGSLTDLFRAVREQLFQDGKELVLLVEDFAVLSGMQGALLQVMITEAYRDGEQVLCTMRSALAYTEGVAHVPETVRTRARSLWTIEDQPGEAEDIHRRVVELVGAYLNAARVGQTGLRDAFEAADDADHWVPVVDGHDLEDETKAVLKAFGASAAGYPLFPFNREAIRQLTEQGSRKDGALVFNPRNVINNVLGKVLRERGAFERGRFPHEALAERLRSAEVTSAVVRSIPDQEKQRRALTLLACWGDQPSMLAEAALLPEAVFAAFELPQPTLGGAPLQTKTRPASGEVERRAGARQEPEVALPKLDPKEKEWKDALEYWGAGQLLSQQHARQLRKWLAQAMINFAPWDMLPLKIRHNADYLQGLVYLPRSRGQNVLEPSGAFVVVAIETELDEPSTRAGIIRTLLAFVRLHELKGGWAYAGALEDAALCASFLADRVEKAEAYIRSHHFRPEADTIPALTEALLVGARALGVEGAESRQLPMRLSALFGDAKPPDELPDTDWGRDLNRFASHREAMRDWLLEQVGARQGTGAVHGVDVTAIEPTIRQTASAWSITHTLPDGDHDRSLKAAAGALRALRSDLPKTLRQRRGALLTWHSSAGAWFGEDPDKQELRDILRETTNEARKELPLLYDHDSLKRRIAALKDLPLKATLADCARLEKSEEPGDVLSVLVRKPDPVVRATQDLIKEFDNFLGLYTREVETRLRQHGEDAVEEGSEAIREELKQIRDLLDAMQEARS
jgi:hypothetical protein